MYEEKEENVKEKKVNRFFQKEKTKKEKKPKKEKVKKEKILKPKENNSESKKVLGIKADWVSILVKLGLFLLIVFFAIFVVTKVRQTFSKNSFTDNMEKMKDVAYTYFKLEKNRPIEVGEETLLTLDDLEKASLISELKDSKKNVCSKDYSYVSLIKKSDTKYLLKIYLSCGGEAQNASYDLTYSNSKDSGSSVPKTVLYELKRNVVTEDVYTCPSGYMVSGRYCVGNNTVTTINATPRYRVTPAKEYEAKLKKAGYEYEIVEPISTVTNPTYVCDTKAGYHLEGTKCIKEGTVRYHTTTDYVCNNGTPSGTKCLITTAAIYSTEQAYCSRGRLVDDDSCYVSIKPSVRCLLGKKDTTRNACYTTYSASKVLSDWMFESKVKYRDGRVPKDTEKVMYERVEELDNGYTLYRKFVRKYTTVCDGDDKKINGTCRHYDASYEEKYCSNSKYDLSQDGTECYMYEDASYKTKKGTYDCPNGYSPKGSGSSTRCVRYETAIKKTENTPYCSGGYDLTEDGKCVKVVDATLEESKTNYTCPDGYVSRGSKSNPTCYKKVKTDSYYYCTNSKATLENNRCIIEEETKFLGYSCPSGYSKNGNICTKTNSKERFLATKSEKSINNDEIIWSKSKNVSGWTWTGNTKEV